MGRNWRTFLLVGGEEVVLMDVVLNEYRVEDIKNKVKMVRGDVGNWPQVMNVVKDNKVTDIYHLGSMLSYMSEGNPWGSFQGGAGQSLLK